MTDSLVWVLVRTVSNSIPAGTIEEFYALKKQTKTGTIEEF
jgi:hypothetical protein